MSAKSKGIVLSMIYACKFISIEFIIKRFFSVKKHCTHNVKKQAGVVGKVLN